MRDGGSVRVQPPRLYRVRGGLLPGVLVSARIDQLLLGLRRDLARAAVGQGVHPAAARGRARLSRSKEAAMMSTCECGLLHAEPRRAHGCRECDTPCCPSCAIEIDSQSYCRWCALVLAPAA